MTTNDKGGAVDHHPAQEVVGRTPRGSLLEPAVFSASGEPATPNTKEQNAASETRSSSGRKRAVSRCGAGRDCGVRALAPDRVAPGRRTGVAPGTRLDRTHGGSGGHAR